MVMVVKLTTSFPLTISQWRKKICWLVGTMLKLQEPVRVLRTVDPDGRLDTFILHSDLLFGVLADALPVSNVRRFCVFQRVGR